MSYYRRSNSDLYIYEAAVEGAPVWICDNCPHPGAPSTVELHSRWACFWHWVGHRRDGHDAPFRGRNGHGGILALLLDAWDD